MTIPMTDEQKQQTQTNLQNYLKEVQTGSLPRSPRRDTPSLADQPTVMMPAMPRTDKLPTLRQRSDFESWLDGHIFDFWEREHRFPHVVHISSIRKLEHIVEQLERHESTIRWNEYVFRHTGGWITIKLETKIMNYHEVECE